MVSYLAGLELGDPNLGYVVGRIYAMLFFCGKDCFMDHCTRSIGKKIMKLEIVNKHGELSGLYRNFFRTTYSQAPHFTVDWSCSPSSLPSWECPFSWRADC